MSEDRKLLEEKMIYLISCALHCEAPDKEQTGALDLAALYKLAAAHSLTATVCMALEAADTFAAAPAEVVKCWKDARDKAVRKNMLLDAERAQILGEMERAGIWYMPLKGSVLKDLYPKYGMRQMADNDILYDPSRQMDLKEIFVRRGYDAEWVGRSIHDVYTKPPVYNFEMHTALFADSYNGEWAQYYGDVKQRLRPDAGKVFGYHFTDEDFYVYITAHAYKHYSNSGTGLRTLVDTYVFNWKKGETLDREYIRGELERLGIAEFEERSRKLGSSLFGSVDADCVRRLSEEQLQLLDYFCGSGTYGTMQTGVKNKLRGLQADGSPVSVRTKLRYYRSRLFPGREWCRMPYPFIYRHPYLLPFLWGYRIVRTIVFARKRIRNEIRVVAEVKE